MGKKGQPVTTYKKPTANGQQPIVNPVESDEFNSTTIGNQWQWQANYNEKFGVPTAFGTMRIFTYKQSEQAKNLWLVPNMLLQKTPADEFTATTKLRFTSKAEGQVAGLIMMGLDYQALLLKRVGKEFQLFISTCQQADKGKTPNETLIATLKPTAEDKIIYHPGIHEDIYLRLQVTLPDAAKLKNNKGGFDGKPLVRFSYSLDGKTFTPCGDAYKMRQGKWIGAKFGYVAVENDVKSDRGWIDVDWMRITK
jgi:beta-xylosidase